MNILLVGNGFDIAHGLQTRYSDFIELCEIDREYGKSITWSDQKPHVSPSYVLDYSRNKALRYESFCNYIKHDAQVQFHNIVENNIWIDHFCEIKNTISDKWINFETEIERVVKQIYEDCKGKIYVNEISDKKLYRYIRNKYGETMISVSGLWKILQDELRDFSKALEIYICSCFDTNISRLDTINKLSIDKVISFNYSDTYARVYNPSTDICYIHGKADLNLNMNNVVLGFDDHYFGNEDISVEMVPFEKYYQRIVNKTNINYLAWHESIKAENPSILYIYGHSLAPSDGDILRKFILETDISVKIYCIDEFDRAEKIANLAVILKPDNLIKFAGGRNNRIEFIMI